MTPTVISYQDAITIGQSVVAAKRDISSAWANIQHVQQERARKLSQPVTDASQYKALKTALEAAQRVILSAQELEDLSQERLTQLAEKARKQGWLFGLRFQIEMEENLYTVMLTDDDETPWQVMGGKQQPPIIRLDS